MSQQTAKNAGGKGEKSMVRDLTNGSVPILLLTFAAPLFVSNALQAIYNVVDMVVVGQVIGKSGMAAVSVGGNVLHIMTFLAMGFSSAGQILISRAVGRKDLEQVKRIIGTLFTILICISLAIMTASIFLREQLLHLINTPDDIFDATMDYTIVCVIGLIFIYGYNCVSAIMRGMGDSKRPFVFISVAAILNTVLDILFVAVFDMREMGAAMATVIGQAVSFIIAIIYLYRNKEAFGFDFKPKSFVPDKETFGRIMGLGIPLAIQSAAITISHTLISAWINAYGSLYISIAGILGKLNMLMGIMSNAITTAAASMTGQNIGAKKFKRVPQILGWALSLSMGIAAVCTIGLLLGHDMIFRMFTKDMEVVTNAYIIIGPAILNFLGAATRTFAFALINGSGNSKLNLLVAILDGIVVRITMASFLGFYLGMGAIGFWYGDGIAGMVPLFIGLVFFLSGKWKK